MQDPVSPYDVMAGTVISASLMTGTNSDLPGDVTAQVTEDVYDTVTGCTLLVPQGSRLIEDAWQARSNGETPRDYLRIRLDDPSLPEPLSAALFWANDGTEALLDWNRRREDA